MWLVIYLLIIVLEYRCTSSNVDMTAPIALITGYTGESGKALVNRLVKSNQYRKVILVGRRNVEYTDNDFKEKTEQRQIDFDKIDDYVDAFRGADVHFCCLGTTRGKSGADGFRRVDYDYVVGAARLAKQAGFKGQSEAAITQMAFERLSIYRPAMLMVDRAEDRLMERVLQTILRNTIQRIAPEWLTTPIDVLARAMANNTFTKDRPSLEILDNHAIFRLAEQALIQKNDEL